MCPAPTDPHVAAGDVRDCLRFNIVGTSGSGKSTLARRLSEILDIPFHEIDALHFEPDWREVENEVLFARIREITDQDRWILDGNYTKTLEYKWRRVQVVVWVDMPFLRTVWRVIVRSIKRSFSGKEVWPGTGCRETLTKTFLSRDSIVAWAVYSYGKNRRQYAEFMESEEYRHIRFIRLKSAGEVEDWIRTVERDHGGHEA